MGYFLKSCTYFVSFIFPSPLSVVFFDFWGHPKSPLIRWGKGEWQMIEITGCLRLWVFESPMGFQGFWVISFSLMVSPSYYWVIGFRLGSLVLGSWWRPWVFGSLLSFPLCQTKLYFFLIFFGRFSAIPNETTFFSNSLYDNAIKDNSRSSSPEVFCGKGDLKLY